MQTYNFILWDEEGNSYQIEINAHSEAEAWKKIKASHVEYTCIDLIHSK